MTFRQNFFLEDKFTNKLGVGLGRRLVPGVRIRVGFWNRVSVSIVALLRFVTLRPAK